MSNYVDAVISAEKVYRLLLDVVRLELTKLKIRDLQQTQALLLYKMGKDSYTIGELLQKQLYLGSNISYSMKKMIDHDYIKYKKSERDKRLSFICLSQKGLELWEKLDTAFNEHYNFLEQSKETSFHLELLEEEMKNMERCLNIIRDDVSLRNWLMAH